MSRKIVVKFGGSNLKSKEDISRLIQVVRLYAQPLVIVVSALYGVTDRLVETLRRAPTEAEAIPEIEEYLVEAHLRIIELYIDDEAYREQVADAVRQRVEELEKNLRGVHYLGEVPDFVEDRVLSYGERLSSLVLTAIFNYNRIETRECLPETLGLITNGEFRNASVDFDRSRVEVRRQLEGDDLCVIPGFYGICPDGRVTLFGRGGTDYTAAAVACCIDAKYVDLWKDVQGFMSADPKLVECPVAIHRLTYDEAAELSYFGARILHPRIFEPVLEKKIPVRVFNITDIGETLEPVTEIRENGVIKKDIIKSVTFSDDFGILRLHGAGVGIKPGIMAKVTTALHREEINIKSIITAQTCINLLLGREDLQRSRNAVKELGLTTVDELKVYDGISVIAVVGAGMLEKPGIAARVFSAVSLHHINIHTISTGASNVATYFVIDRGDRAQAVQAIHDEFFCQQN